MVDGTEYAIDNCGYELATGDEQVVDYNEATAQVRGCTLSDVYRHGH